jgi:hypothetical protein
MRNDSGKDESQITVVGNPDSRRVRGFAADAQRLGWTVRSHSYADLARRSYSPPPSGIVRLESPAECDATFRLMLRAGIEPMEAEDRRTLSRRQIDELPLDRGEIVAPRQWYLGFREVMRTLAARWEGATITWMSTPASLAMTFDKIACLKCWENAGLPTAKRYDGVAIYEYLRKVVNRRHARLFIKLRYGYSAMGAVALEWRDDRVRAITTVETSCGVGGERLFVSKKPRVLQDEAEIASLIDRLGVEGIVVEEWLPKARWKGRPFDLRVVVVRGVAYHVVGRASSSPFTNLNLDAARIPQEDLVELLGASWGDVETLCSDSARQLSEAGMLGIDLLVRPGCREFALLEANGFGDYLPGLTVRGMSTWEVQLRQISAALEAAV